MKTCRQEITSPIGRIIIVADSRYLRAVTFADNREPRNTERKDTVRCSNAITHQTCTQLQEYFSRQRTVFDLPLVFTGTDFQNRAWQYLLTIPHGETRSYSQQAQAIGNPKAVRAVGRANGANPIAIVVPCHRVIGISGRLTGYAGGLKIKQFLLQLEQSVHP